MKFHRRAYASLARKKRFAIYTVLALLVAGIKSGTDSSPREASSAGQATLSSVAARTKDNSSAYRFVSGERLVYRLHYSSASLADFGALFRDRKASGANEASPAISFKTTLRSDLVAEVVNTNDEGALIAYRLRNPDLQFAADGQARVMEAEIIKTELSQRAFAFVDPRGKVLSVLLDPALGSHSQTFCRTLLALTQFVLPDLRGSEPRQWETQEDDPNGQYLARYQIEPGPDRGASNYSQAAVKSFRKIRTPYLQPPQKSGSSQPDLSKTIESAGSLVGRFDFGGGYLASLSGSESQRVIIAGKCVGQAEMRLQMDYVGKETSSPGELSALRAAVIAREKMARAAPLLAMASGEEREAAIQRNALGNSTLESLQADLANAELSASETYDDTRLYLRLKALISLYPENCEKLGQILIAADPASHTMRLLVGALGAVGHPEAQAALARAARMRAQDWPALSLLIPALGESRNPTRLAEETLRDLTQSADWNIKTTAQLSLGRMARSLRASSPERAGRIVAEAIREAKSATSLPMIKQWILVLGNAGADQSLPIIARFLDHPSPELRAAATFALRWVESDRADDLLRRSLVTDSSASVRLEAAFAFGFRKITAGSFQTQKRALVTDNDAQVRLAAMRNLWQARGTFPEARRLVQQAVVKDRAREVRRAAADFLAHGDPTD